jgi:hypothetical protein
MVLYYDMTIFMQQVHYYLSYLTKSYLTLFQNGFLSALPFLCRYLFGICVAHILDFCLRRQYITLIKMRRYAVCICKYNKVPYLTNSLCDKYLISSTFATRIGPCNIPIGGL